MTCISKDATPREPAMAGPRDVLYVAGVSHHASPVALRERFARATQATATLLPALRSAAPAEEELELLLLPTCNRMELYLAGRLTSARVAELWSALLAEVDGSPVPPDYLHAGRAAARHLGRVSCGLESMVPGEMEILGQVADAARTASEMGTLGTRLGGAVRTALRAGRRARQETQISRGAGSVSSAALTQASERLGGLAGRTVAVLGAGRMARRALHALRSEPSTRVIVVARRVEAADELAGIRPIETRAWDALEVTLGEADLVLTAVRSAEPVVGVADVARALAARGLQRPLLLVDVGMPRNLEPEIALLAGAEVLDLDALQQHVATSLMRRSAEVPKVEAIIEQEIATLARRPAAAGEVDALLRDLRRQAEAIRQRELRRVQRHLPADLPPEVQRQFDQFSAALVRRLLHVPAERLKGEAQGPRGRTFLKVSRALLALEEEEELRERAG